ncbi:MORC family CW-type zinc finger protein 3-like [Anomaloglossus baeobatrachus]|uniref:MORC family CW-type zinc finger protein 3-like n=1 Tax=Anomaloglossus baeobatrachus TaxID=238106 RepID=UPI003F4FBB03
MAAQTTEGIRLSALCPKFLHTNSTSHTWPFSAVAELIDNAYDPDVKANKIWIDQTILTGHQILTFTDNGNGMTVDKLHRMLSFGFSDKVAVQGHIPVGLYGNGFKSGSMRLGKDAIVLTKNDSGMHVGMLSQSYLEAVKAENVIVPIISFDKQKQLVKNSGSDVNLAAITKYSLLGTKEVLLTELEVISGKKGTRIIIWNLRRDMNNKLEFDFDTDNYDIRIPEECDESSSSRYRRQERADHVGPDSDYSLRAYCSILYVKPRIQIILRGLKVQTKYVSKNLAHIEKDVYKPSGLHKPVPITFGYNCQNKEHYGMMMYNKNRLIKAYERVGCQKMANNMGVGVVGVIECNYLKPTHNKQDFDYTNEYRLTLTAIGAKLNDYWKTMKEKKSSSSSVPVEDEEKQPDQNWVQCDTCNKWRKLPDGVEAPPDDWFCQMNSDPKFRDCSVDEEPEDDDEITRPTYEKTPKKRKLEQPSKAPVLDDPINLPDPPLKKMQKDLNMTTRSASASNSPSLAVAKTSPQRRSSRIRKCLNSQEPSEMTAKQPQPIVLRYKDFPCGGGGDKKKEGDEDDDKKEEAGDDCAIIMEDISTHKPIKEELKPKNGADIRSVTMESVDSESTGSLSMGIMAAATTQTEQQKITVNKEEEDGNSYGNFQGCQKMSGEQVHQHCDDAMTYHQQNHSPVVQDETEYYKKHCEELILVKTAGQKVIEETSSQDTKYDQVLKKISIRLDRIRKKLQDQKSESPPIGEVDSTSEMDDIVLQLDDILRRLDSFSAEKVQSGASSGYKI